MKRHHAPLLLLGSTLCVLAMMPGDARALTTCTTNLQTPANIFFSNVNGTNEVKLSTTATISCRTTSNLYAGTVKVRACLYIGNTPRRLLNGSNVMAFDLYTPTGSAWRGYSPSVIAAQQFDFEYNVPGFFGSANGSHSVTIEARIPAQTGLVNGTYSASFQNPHTAAEYRYDEPGLFGDSAYPTSCKSGGDSGQAWDGRAGLQFPFNVTAAVPPHCRFTSVTTLDFGATPGFITGNLDGNSQISMTCTSPTTWTLQLNNGLNPSGNQRRMTDGSGNYVDYALYRDPARLQDWRTAAGSVLTGTGTGGAQTITVHGRVPTQSAAPGTYSDTVTATVVF